MTRWGRGAAVVAAGAFVLAALACSGLRSGTTEVEGEMEALQGSTVGESAPLVDVQFGGTGSAPDLDDGNGVQILHASPYGPEQKSVQIAVVFDRPMIAMTDLDAMKAAVPLSCTPDVGQVGRWAGTSTAVLVPKDNGTFPRATHYECTVAGGTKAVDGVALEKTVSWTFDSPVPRVVSSTPSSGVEDFDPRAQLELGFDQPVEPEAVAAHLKLVDGANREVAFKTGRTPTGETTRVAVAAKLEQDTAYTLTVEPGVVGIEGPLPSTQPFTTSFRTYPPLTVTATEPSGKVSPSASIGFHTATRVSRDEIGQHLSITPTPEGWKGPTGEWAWTDFRLGIWLQPNTKYTVRLSAGLTDIYGQKLAKPAEWSFETGDYDPWIDAPTGLRLYASNNPPELPFKHLNAVSIDATAARFDPNTLTKFGDWPSLRDSVLSSPTRSRFDIDVDPTPNRVELDNLPFETLLGGNGTGWVATRLQAPNVVASYDNQPIKYSGLFVVTDLGTTLKIGPRSTDAWVTSLSTGAPVSGATVALFVGAKPVGTQTTDASGLARFDDAPSADWSRWSDPMWAKVTHGADVSLVTSEWTDGLAPWSFSIYDEDFVDRTVESHGFADRGVYRLGDPVYARATFRVKSAKGLETPKGKVKWSLGDPEGTTIASGDGQLDARGGFSVTTQLPEEGQLGGYSLSVDAEGTGWRKSQYISVPARAYRPPAFRVEVAGPESSAIGQEVKATVDARYLFGAPLKKGKVQWRAWTEARSFEPEGWDGWSFGTEYRWWEESQPTGEGTLGSKVMDLTDGHATWSQVVQPSKRRGPVALFMEAEVTDVDRQVIANRSTTLVHPAQYYVALRAKQRLPKVGDNVEVEVTAVDPDGKPVNQSVSVSIVRRDWNSVRERGMNGQWRWVNTTVDDPVAAKDVSTGATPQTASFTPKKSGYYVVTATGKDAVGNVATSEYGIYVVGAGYVGWGRRDDNHLELVADKKKYQPGDTARFLVKSPAEKLNALVTVEREGVLWRKVVTLEGTAATLEVPITAAFRPNVYVSVVAVQGAGPQDAPDKGRPNVYMGLTNVVVDSAQEHLQVDVTPAAEVYRPRDNVEVSVAVRRDGKPVAGAGVTLYAVDYAILSLTAYKTPDAFSAFYSPRGLGVVTADARTAALDRAAYLTKGAARGGGGGMEEGGPEVRSKFVTTVTWQPDLVTGPDGTVKAKFDLPDNLTTFRIMAIADADATGFGAGEREIRVTRPLIVRPALPRVLRAEDRAFAGVVVHNGVDEDRWVRVTADVAGPVEITGSPVDVKVPAGGAVEVPFQLRALEQGSVKFTFTAASGSDKDALEWPLEVEREVPLDTVGSSGKVETEITEQIARPEGAYTAWGGLTVDVATSALVGAGSGIGYLRAYPHECVEQLTSRTLANLMALRVRDRAQIDVPEAVLKSDVENGLAKLRKYRVSGGGMAYWAGDYRPSAQGTAYAVELMGRAKEAGFKIDEALLSEEVGYLRDVIAGRIKPYLWDNVDVTLAGRTYVASALARAGQGDAGLNNELFSKRKDLSVFGTASLLEAIARTSGADGRTAELARTIAGRSYVEATEASVKENDTGRWARLWGSDDLSTAAALEALVIGGSEDPLIPKYALHLAGSKVGDRWANTRATAGVLASLAAYAEKFEAPVGSKVDAKITLAGKNLFNAAIAVPGSDEKVVPMAKVDNGPLVFSAKGGPLYYEARLAYAPKDPKPRDEGFAVQRSLEVLDGAGPNGTVIGGTTLRVTLSVVTPVQRTDVAVIDPVPAGLEIVDNSFATTSRAPEGDGDGAETENMYELGYTDSYEDRSDELPDYGGSWVFDHHELDDAEVRLYASYMPPGVHTYRYVVRATSPGTYAHPPATAEEMYEPENFGRSKGGSLTIGGAKAE